MRVSVVLPAPEGDDRIRMKPRRPPGASPSSRRAAAVRRRERHSPTRCFEPARGIARSRRAVQGRSRSAPHHSTLAQIGRGLAAEFLGEEIEPPPARAAGRDEIARGRRRGSSVDRAPRARPPWRRESAPPDAVGSGSSAWRSASIAIVCASFSRTASGWRCGAASACRARRPMASRRCTRMACRAAAFGRAHGQQPFERGVEA